MSPHNVCFLSASPVWPMDERRRLPLCGGLVRAVRLGRRIGQFVTRPYWGALREGNQSGSRCADLHFLLAEFPDCIPTQTLHFNSLRSVSAALPSYISTFIPPQLLSSLSLIRLNPATSCFHDVFEKAEVRVLNWKQRLKKKRKRQGACFSGGHMLAGYKSPH